METQTRRLLTLTLVAVPLLAALVWLLFAMTGGTGVRTDRPAATTAGPSEPDTAARPDTGATPEPGRTEIHVPPGAAAVAIVRVRGRVLDRYGEPLGDALVSDIESRYPTTTPADGRFRLLVELGDANLSVTLLVHAADHAVQVTRLDLEPQAQAVDAGDIQLLSGGGIRGQITDHLGNGLPGATATLRPVSGNPWPRSMDLTEILEPAPASAEGFYSFAHLMPGQYRITASAPGMQRGQSSTAQVVDGAETEVDPIALEIGFELTGVVIGPDDAPVPGADVHVRGGVNGPRFDGRVQTTADGRFRIGALPPGPLRVDVQRAGFLSFSRSDVDPTRGQELVVRLEGGLRVTGTVVDSRSGLPVEQFAASIHRIGELDPRSNGTTVQQLRRQTDALRATAASATDPEVRAEQLRIATELESRLERVRREGQSRPVSVPADVGPVAERPLGRFTFDGLEEGIYTVGIASPDHRFARVEPVELRRGMPGRDLRVEVTEGLTLRGRIVSKRDGTGVAGATVDLVRVMEASPEVRDRRRSLYPWVFARSGPQGVTLMVARSADDGSFEFRQAAPGRCFLSVRHPLIADRDTEAFYVQQGGREIRVEVGARAELTGRIRGVPPGREDQVEVIVLGGHGTMRSARANADGTYRLDRLQPGSYIVRAFPSDSSQYVNRLFGGIFPLHAGAVDPEKIPQCDVTLAEGETRAFDLALDLPPAGVVEGTVSINGAPGNGGRAILRPVPGEAPGSGGQSLRAYFDESGQFTITDVPAGNYTLQLYGPTRQELYREPVTVTAGARATVEVNLVAGGLRGRVTAPDAVSPAELRGYLWVLPGAAQAPADLYEYRRTERAHRIPVRNGEFDDDGLTPGPAVLVVDIRDRKQVASKAVVPAGATLELDLTVAARLP